MHDSGRRSLHSCLWCLTCAFCSAMAAKQKTTRLLNAGFLAWRQCSLIQDPLLGALQRDQAVVATQLLQNALGQPAASEATEEVYRITPRKTAEPLHGPPRRTQERRRDTESSRPLRPADVGLDYWLTVWTLNFLNFAMNYRHFFIFTFMVVFRLILF